MDGSRPPEEAFRALLVKDKRLSSNECGSLLLCFPGAILREIEMDVSHVCLTQVRIPSLFQLRLTGAGGVVFSTKTLGWEPWIPVLTCSPIHRGAPTLGL